MAKKLNKRVKCTDRHGNQFEVQIFDNYIGAEGSNYVGQSAGLPDTSAVQIITDGTYRVVWNNLELRSVKKFGVNWGKKGKGMIQNDTAPFWSSS